MDAKLIYNIKPGDKLYCHKDMIFDFGDEILFKKGKWYEIQNTYKSIYGYSLSAYSDMGSTINFAVGKMGKPGKSYEKWFYTKDEYRKNNIDKLLDDGE